MSLHNRVFTEGLQRERRRGNVTLGNLPDYLQKGLERYEIPRVRPQHPGNWPTKTGWERDPRLEYKIASHKVRSKNSPIQTSQRNPEAYAKEMSPQPRTKALKRQELLAKRKELQAKRETDQ